MDQGGVRLSIGWDGERVVAARVECRRPQAARLLVGRPVAEALALAPHLFSLCGRAQGAAAKMAAAAAQGETIPLDELRREVVLEAMGEHLWRLLLDWPLLLGRVPEKEAFLAWRKRLIAAPTPAATGSLVAELREWLVGRALPEGVDERAASASALLLPWRNAAEWAAAGIDESFAQRPTLAGQAAETGVLARQSSNPLVADLLTAGKRVAARIAARHADLDFLACGLLDPDLLNGWLDAAPVGVEGTGGGLARVETARGLLLHLMQVKDGRVYAYVIVAPTEWNFHPQGAFASEIVGAGAASRDAAALLARRLSLSLDPCVSYEVVVEELHNA